MVCDKRRRRTYAYTCGKVVHYPDHGVQESCICVFIVESHKQYTLSNFIRGRVVLLTVYGPPPPKSFAIQQRTTYITFYITLLLLSSPDELFTRTFKFYRIIPRVSLSYCRDFAGNSFSKPTLNLGFSLRLSIRLTVWKRMCLKYLGPHCTINTYLDRYGNTVETSNDSGRDGSNQNFLGAANQLISSNIVCMTLQEYP